MPLLRYSRLCNEKKKEGEFVHGLKISIKDKTYFLPELFAQGKFLIAENFYLYCYKVVGMLKVTIDIPDMQNSVLTPEQMELVDIERKKRKTDPNSFLKWEEARKTLKHK